MRRGIRARRVVRRLELWSVAKVAFFFHLCCGVVSLAAVVGLWFVADRIGTREQIESFLGDLLGTKDFQLFGDKLLRAAMGVTGALIVLATVGTVVMAFLYNMLSGIFGGVVVSVLQERVPLPRDVKANAEAAQAELDPARGSRRRRKRRRRKRPVGPPPVPVYEPPVAVGLSSDPNGVIGPIAGPGPLVPPIAAEVAVDDPASVWAPDPGETAQGVPAASASDDWIGAAADPTGSWMSPGSRS